MGVLVANAELESVEDLALQGVRKLGHMRKPDPEIYQLTLERLDCSGEECIYVDDAARIQELLGLPLTFPRPTGSSPPSKSIPAPPHRPPSTNQ